MANDNKNIKELVDADDDPTEELEALVIADDGDLSDDTISQLGLQGLIAESDGPPAVVADEPTPRTLPASEPESGDRRSETAEAPEQARIAAQLSQAERELAAARHTVVERDARISALETDLMSLTDTITSLQRGLEPVQPSSEGRRSKSGNGEEPESEPAGTPGEEELAGRLAVSEAEIRRLKGQLEKTEAYADVLRHNLADLASDASASRSERGSLTAELESLGRRLADTEADLDAARALEAELKTTLNEARAAHEQEMRILRFELGEAESTSNRFETINEQLLSELVSVRNLKDRLELTLASDEQQYQARIDDYESRVAALETEIGSYRERLESKSKAISSLLEELAKTTERDEPDDAPGPRPTENKKNMNTSQDSPTAYRSKRPDDGIARLLVSRFDDRELRFPLFKDRLTIGRTSDNDIQLNAQFISRRHAVICSDGEATRIIDWDSKNGVFVNSKRITEHFLSDGDIVTVGDAEFRYEERLKQER